MLSHFKELILPFISRHHKPVSLSRSVNYAIKGFVIITLISGITFLSETPLIVAPFGASCIVLITLPHRYISQPITMFGGYMIAATVAIICLHFFPHEWWVNGIMTGLTIFLMAFFRVIHPPAGSVPMLVYYENAQIGIDYLLFPVLTGVALLIITGWIAHRIPPTHTYPIPIRRHH